MATPFPWLFIACQLFVLAITAPVFFKRFDNPLENGVIRMEQDINSFADEELQTFSYNLKWNLHCSVCHYTVSATRKFSSGHKSQAFIMKFIYKICRTFHIEDEKVCKGVVKEFQSEFFYVIKNVTLTPEEVCGIIIGPQCTSKKDPYDKWNVTFPKTPKPPVTPIKPPKPGSPKLRILHLSDIHLDPLYKEGTNTDCGEPLCCRADNGPPKKGIRGAGKWGDYRSCDVPPRTLDNLFQHLKSIQDKFDCIYWTGDLPPHNIWSQTRTDQTKAISVLTDYFLKYLPKKTLFPVVGNHESAPVNSFPPSYITGNNSISWLYSALNKSWANWLPKETYGTIKRGAFYTVSPFPGFRIVSINTNYCNTLNWWLMSNLTDPNHELEWLISVLQKAEDNHEKVHIIGHIPPGVLDCLTTWSFNYYKIISRYESTIVGQFFGHIHLDSYEMFYDVNNMKRPVSMAYIGSSVTPYLTNTAVNPSFRIYEVDGNYNSSSWAVLDYDSYILDLKLANERDKPVWIKEYSAKATYNLPSLSPANWNNLIEIMKTDDTVLKLFNRYKYKSTTDGSCSSTCRRELLCSLRSGRSNDPSLCKDL